MRAAAGDPASGRRNRPGSPAFTQARAATEIRPEPRPESRTTGVCPRQPQVWPWAAAAPARARAQSRSMPRSPLLATHLRSRLAAPGRERLLIALRRPVQVRRALHTFRRQRLVKLRREPSMRPRACGGRCIGGPGGKQGLPEGRRTPIWRGVSRPPEQPDCRAYRMPDRENQQPIAGRGLGPEAVLASGLVRGMAGSRRLR